MKKFLLKLTTVFIVTTLSAASAIAGGKHYAPDKREHFPPIFRNSYVGFGAGYTVNPRDDMATYIESTKHIFKSELLYLHFLDFESLYAQYGHRTPPKTLLEKIVRRTDNWIKVLLRQAREGTLFIIIGNHGRHPIPLDYEGKLAEWRNANAPIAIMFQKRTE